MYLNNQIRRRKLILGLTLTAFFVLIFFIFFDNHEINHYETCFAYSAQSNSENLLEDLEKAQVQPSPDGKNIFFHLTSCSGKYRLLKLNARQACAVESAARLNPTMSLFVLVASKVGLKNGELFKSDNIFSGIW